jgi:hypothetical protein
MLEQHSAILAELRNLARTRKSIRLFNIYKGFPISHDARILSIGIDAITLKVHRHQALCLWMENQTYIQNDALPALVKAIAITVDLENDVAALSNFEYVSGATGGRDRERILPGKVIEVTVTIQATRLKSELRDLSTKGMAFYLDAAYYNPNIFRLEEPLQLTFQLPGSSSQPGREIELSGVIKSITRDRVDRYRIGIQVRADDQDDPLVSQYVVQRQMEVMQEIEMLHESFLKLSGYPEDSD